MRIRAARPTFETSGKDDGFEAFEAFEADSADMDRGSRR
jgi:hypothetical protein